MVLVYLAIVHLISIMELFTYTVNYIYYDAYAFMANYVLIIIMIQSLQELILKCNLGDNR